MIFLFFMLAALAIASAFGVLFSRAPLYSAFSLVINLMTVAGLFATLDAHFLAASQIIVYAGAIMVLVVFVIMLLSLTGEERKPFSILFVVSSVLGGAGLAALLVPLLEAHFPTGQGLGAEGTVEAMGTLLFSQYVYPFELASVLILAAIVGAVMLARRLRQE